MAVSRQSTFFLRPLLLIVLLTLFSFVLRITNLDAQSFWYDEAFAAFYAKAGIIALFKDVPSENHPPLFFLTLQAWQTIVGTTEFALRYLSVLFGVATIPLAWKLASRLFWPNGSIIGILTALFLAISPMHVWFSQEARMYTPAGFLGLLSLWLLFKAMQGRKPVVWLGYVVFSILGAFTHFYFVFLVCAEAVYAAGVFLSQRSTRDRRLAAQWAGSQLSIGVLLLPLALKGLSVLETNRTYWAGPLDIATVFNQAALSFAGGLTLAGSLAEGFAFAWVLLYALGVSLARVRQRGELIPGNSRSLFLAIMVVVPIALLVGVSMSAPKAAPRYVLFTLPVFYLSGAVGVVGLVRLLRRALAKWRFERIAVITAGFVILAPFLAIAGLSLSNLYAGGPFSKEDFRGLVGYVEAHSLPGDSAIIVGGHAEVAYDYYSKTSMPVYPVPKGHLPDISNPVGPEVVGLLNELAAEYERVWLIRWQNELADPANHVLYQLSTNSQRLNVDKGFHGLELFLFSLDSGRPFKAEPDIQWQSGVSLERDLEFLGFDVDKLYIVPGQSLGVTLYWRTSQKQNEDLTVFLHLLNNNNQVVCQIDKRPINDFYTVGRWQPGEIVRDEYYLKVPPETPSGRYTLEMGIYNTANRTRLRTIDTGDDRVILLQPDVGK